MQSRGSTSFAGILAGALGLGCAFGLLHAVAETTFLGWIGIRPAALDLAIIVVLSAGGASALAALVALARVTPPLRGVLVSASAPHAFRTAVWTIITGAYFLVFLRIIYYWSGWSTPLWALVAAPPLIFAWRIVLRRGQRALVTVCASALVVATLCALQIVHAEWANNPDTAGVLSTWLLLPAGVCLLAVIAVVIAAKRTLPENPFEPISRAALALATIVAVWVAGFWVGPRLAMARPFRTEVSSTTNASRPNFLLVVLDTVRADHLDLFGYERETMPHLRRFAEEDCQYFGPMFTTASWTVPSHASMFTGLYSSAHGAHHPFVHDPKPPLAYPLRDDVVTLAEMLGSLGYQTAGLGGNFGALSGFGLSRGFADYDVAAGSAGRAPDLLWFHRFRLGHLPTLGQLIAEQLPDAVHVYSKLFSLREPPYRRAREITNQAQQWLDRNGQQRFFLFLNYFDAHFPYLPLPQDDERFARRPEANEWRTMPTERYRAHVRGQGEFTPAEKAFLVGQYDAEMVGLDREFGRLVDYLRANGFLENTVILVTTDHGESQFEHGLIDHGNSLYKPETNGFLLLKTPDSVGAIEPSSRMQFVDFVPTILTILGEPIPPEVQGSAWGAGRDYVLSELFCKPGALQEPDEWPDHFRRDRVAVVIDNHKLIRSTHDPDEVYDLEADPAELQPLTDPDPEFLRRAEEVIAERNKRLVEGLSADPEDKKLLERLRSLGYVQ